MRVAAIQTGPATPDRKANLEAAVVRLQKIEPRPNVIIFPELFALPFWCVGLSHPRYFDWAEDLDGPTLTTLGAAARAMGSYILAPFFERGEVEGQYFNSAALLGPDGQPIPGRLPSGEQVLTYRKNAISAYQWVGHENDEKYYFRPGNGFPVFDIVLGKVGILICYDRWYPEAWRVLALQGAQIVLVPNASEGYVSEMFVPLMRACAAQNLVFAVACNRAGMERVEGIETRYYGLSCIVGPSGEVLAQATEGGSDEIIAADIQVDRVVADRRRLWIYRDRRPELYELVARSN